MPYSWESRPATIYAIRCKENGRVYIGATANLQNRIREHLSELSDQNKTGYVSKHRGLLKEDYDKYGKEAFEVYIIKTDVPGTERRNVEAEFIAKYRATNPKFGYNIRAERPIDYGVPVFKGEPPIGNGTA